ncbi:MAG: prephenate dehydratase [Corynebacterium sp.]|nr:prephenate dehydratase [Corynebacterium sp.]
MSISVAFLGPAGTFTEAAMLRLVAEAQLGDVPPTPGIPGKAIDEAVGQVKSVVPLPVNSPNEAFAAVRDGRAQYACVAIENSVDGAVTMTFDAFVEGDELQVYRETDLDISFAIMGKKGLKGDEIRTVATHPVAYQQVRGWLAAHVPEAKFQPASSNAAAAEVVSRGEVDAAAAPARAAEVYGLEILADDVADVAGATTRFVLVGKPGKPTARTGNDRTSVVFTIPNEPGSLVHVLQEFAYRGVDLTRIESRPMRTQFGTYRFFVDLVGHIDDEPVAEALRALWLRAEDVRFIGSWPSASVQGKPLDTAAIQEASNWVARLQNGS